MMRTLRPVAATALLLLLAVFLLPMLLLGPAEEGEAPEETGPLPTATLPIQKPTAQSGAGGDGATLIRVAMADGTVASLTMAEYLWRVVAAEMPASFEEEALRAQAEGADYLGVGAMFPTGTKTNTVPTSADTLKAICAAVSIPVVAIGGVNAQNLPTLAGTGIAGAAVVSAIFSQSDLTAAARTLRAAADLAAR